MFSSFRFTVLTLSTCLITGSASAAAFYIQEQSTTGLGRAFAGASAYTPDASTVFYNPAGMTDLGGPQMVAGVSILVPDANFEDTGSTAQTVAPAAGAVAATQGGNGGNPFGIEGVPHAYVTWQVPASDFWLGFGVSAPFGLANKYDDNFTGRYNSLESELRVLDFAPTVAWRANDWLSLGGGINVQYADAKLTNAIPDPVQPGVLAADGYADLSGDDVSVGYNVGAIVKPFDGTRLGLHYRMGVRHELEGRLIVTAPAAGGGTSVRVPGEAVLELPDIASFGISQEIGPRWRLLGSVNWSNWSVFESIPVELATGAQSATQQNYEDTWSFAIGAEYDVHDRLTLRAGAQYDQTPTVDNFRSTRVPDGDRTWGTVGATWDVNERWTLDLAGAYIHVGSEKVNVTDEYTVGAATVQSVTRGDTDGSVGIVSAALRYKF